MPLSYSSKKKYREINEFFINCSSNKLTTVKNRHLSEFLRELKPISKQIYRLTRYLEFLVNERQLYLERRRKKLWSEDEIEKEYSLRIKQGQQIVNSFRQVLEKYFITVASWKSFQMEERQLQLQESILELDDFIYNYQKLTSFM